MKRSIVDMRVFGFALAAIAGCSDSRSTFDTPADGGDISAPSSTSSPAEAESSSTSETGRLTTVVTGSDDSADTSNGATSDAENTSWTSGSSAAFTSTDDDNASTAGGGTSETLDSTTRDVATTQGSTIETAASTTEPETSAPTTDDSTSGDFGASSSAGDLGSASSTTGASSTTTESLASSDPSSAASSDPSTGGTDGSDATSSSDAMDGGMGAGDAAHSADADAGFECSFDDDCDVSLNPCVVNLCHNNVCMPMPVAEGVPLLIQETEGDCREDVCDGNGNVVARDDDGDTPPNDNPCLVVTCNQGAIDSTPADLDAPCGPGGGSYCDGDGSCVECTSPSQCPGINDDCQATTCNNNECGVAYSAQGTLTTVQSPGDCKANQCDGAGGTESVNDDDDVLVDNNQCTADVCSNGVSSNPPVDGGEVCNQNGGVQCDGAGTCISACTANNECASGMCYAGTCVETVNGCNIDTAMDLTASPTTTVTFPNGNLTYSPKCIKVAQGTEITFAGSFSSHPLLGGTVVNGTASPASSGPFVPVTNTGTSTAFTMSSPGTFPYYCVPHATLGMNGAVFVVPQP